MEPVGIEPTSGDAFPGGYYVHIFRVDFAIRSALKQTFLALDAVNFRRHDAETPSCS